LGLKDFVDVDVDVVIAKELSFFLKQLGSWNTLKNFCIFASNMHCIYLLLSEYQVSSMFLD